MRPENHPRPKLLDGIIEFTLWSIENPMNGLDYLEMGFHDAVFIKDFGPWKKGHKPYSLYFDPFHCTLTEGNNFGELLKECHVKIDVC